MTVQEIIEEIDKMTVLELNELVKACEEKYGVSATAGVVVAAGGAAGGAAADEKSEFDVELTSFGEKKMDVIKLAKTALGLGLKEAKEKVESAPTIIKEAASKEEAEDLKAKFEEAGATITLK